MIFPKPEQTWANAYATSYKVPEENKLQRKTYDIGSFIKWFCRRTGKKKLCKADLEGPTFNLVKAFHKNSVFLQFQMDECHKLLTNKVDLSNPEVIKFPQNFKRTTALEMTTFCVRDFKNLHPNDFEDLFLLNIQEKLNHLPKTDKISLHTAVNMWKGTLGDQKSCGRHTARD
ncbi:hypothetical protein Tco_0909171 [Tanacetum coccineum]|uniref:Uncharacterized protein n=1 Tax=Tanacetum coccineum TaxID=301880 RepID=A0ABQ5CP75_9ASTR